MSQKVSNEVRVRERHEGEVTKMTLARLPGFIEAVMSEEHDYGSIVVALGLCAAATAWAMNNDDKKGGLSGYQASFVTWEFMRHWKSPSLGDCGARIQNFEDLLYPQMTGKFTSISSETWATVERRARELLGEHANSQQIAPAVRAHWQSIVDGTVPFGLKIS